MKVSQKLPWSEWMIVRRIGSGSYGTVYEIRRERYGIVERAAIKVISFPKDQEELEDQRRSGFEDETLIKSYRQQMQRFLDEYKLLLKVKGRANIVNCDDFQAEPHTDGIGWDIYIKMELLTPLKKYLPREITQEQTIKLGMDMCKALSACHEEGIIHRDIKPDNILVTDSGEFKLGDFGVAKTAERTMTGTRTGTPNFIAPEVYHNEPYGKSVDIYSLGIVLYWMLNRRTLPFLPLPPQMPSPEETQEALLRRMRGEALPRPADGSRALQDVVLKACAYHPNDRYATPEEFLKALERVYMCTCGTEPKQKRKASSNAKAPPLMQQKRKHRKICRAVSAVLAIVAISIIGIVTLIKLTQSESEFDEVAELLATASIGDTVIFGEYEQDNDVSNGKENIEWLVLDKENNCLLIISRDAIDCQQYNTELTNVTWESSTLRMWLNNEFLNEAFGEYEQSLIKTSNASADKNPNYDTDPGNDTSDKVFILSIDEANRYFKSDETRRCAPTEYAIAQGARVSGDYTTGVQATCWCWLRSPGSESNTAANIYDSGELRYGGGRVNATYNAVRPVMWINLES